VKRKNHAAYLDKEWRSENTAVLQDGNAVLILRELRRIVIGINDVHDDRHLDSATTQTS